MFLSVFNPSKCPQLPLHLVSCCCFKAMSLMCTEGFTLLNWGHVAAAHKRNKSQWCLTLTPNNIETIERMTCHCFLRPIWRDLTSRAPTQLFLFTQPYPFPQENNIYTLNSQIFVVPILALLVFVNSICFIHTGKLTCLYYPPSWTLNVQGILKVLYIATYLLLCHNTIIKQT